MIRVLLSAPLCLHIRLSSRFTCWPEMWIVPHQCGNKLTVSAEKLLGVGVVRDSCVPPCNLLFVLDKNLNHNFIQISAAFFSPSGVRSIELA